MTVYTIDFQPVGRRGQCQNTESLLDCAHQLGIGISAICGGKGNCYSCKVRVLSGTVSEPTSSELEVFLPQELADGWRLACQTYPTSDCKLDVPLESMTAPQRTQVEGVEIAIPIEPAVRAYHLELTIPSLSCPQADADRLLKTLNRQYELKCVKVDMGVLRTVSTQLRSWNWQCQATVRHDEVVAIWSTGTSWRIQVKSTNRRDLSPPWPSSEEIRRLKIAATKNKQTAVVAWVFKDGTIEYRSAQNRKIIHPPDTRKRK